MLNLPHFVNLRYLMTYYTIRGNVSTDVSGWLIFYFNPHSIAELFPFWKQLIFYPHATLPHITLERHRLAQYYNLVKLSVRIDEVFVAGILGV